MSLGTTSRMTAGMAAAHDGTRPRVWILQPRIEHYRLPVFDRLVELGHGRYDLEVFGPLVEGAAAGGGTRTYFREFPYRRRSWLGADVFVWPGLRAAIAAERPEVVIANTHLRHVDCWSLPTWCRAVGSAVVGWGKVHSFSGLPGPLLRAGKRRMFKRFDSFIAYGQSSRRELLDLGVEDARIFVAQNTIDTTRIFTEGPSLAARGEALRKAHGLEGTTVLLCVARFDPEKRIDDLLAAWPRLHASHPDLRLVLVGGGQLLDAVRARTESLDPERIVVTGRVPEGDDYAWIAAADMTVQCGAVGLAINQSMACGKPTIIADELGADTEILVHGETGWRYPRGDIDALVAAVESVLADPAAARAVADRARDLVRDSVNIDKMAAAIDACIGQALETSSKRRDRP